MITDSKEAKEILEEIDSSNFTVKISKKIENKQTGVIRDQSIEIISKPPNQLDRLIRKIFNKFTNFLLKGRFFD
ncbi:MAG: hypothetical protein B6I26_06310 [Desulfobacteraceae bacterium 4572_130]|nr:MAG: hypothetical protein B6I26_06310 [Desulfobacteraceae bacterium 4572_130]